MPFLCHSGKYAEFGFSDSGKYALFCQRGEFEARGGTNDLDDGAPKELIILILEAADAAAFDLSSSARCCGCYYLQDKLHLGYFSLN